MAQREQKHLTSRIVRFRLAVIVTICLSISIVALVFGSASIAMRGTAPSPAATANDSCTVPGVSVITDASGDTGTGSVPTVPGTAAQDITEVLIAEPASTDGIDRIAFTMRVADLTALPPNGLWRIFFSVGATAYYVGAFNDATAGMKYDYGTSGTITSSLGAADSGAVDVTNKTISIFIAKSKIGSPLIGSSLTAIYGRTQTLVGASAVGGATPTHDLAPNSAPTSGMPNYSIVGNSACAGASPTPTPTPNASPTATPTATPITTPTATPTPSGCPANDPTSFSIHMSPTGMGDGWGEPSIGVNWTTEQVFNGTPNGGTVMSYGGINQATALRITFDDTNPAAPVANWERTATLPLASTQRQLGDPILFTDHDTGRTLISQLLGGTFASTTDITNDDGRTFSPSQGFGIISGVDHQTIGGGPFHAPLTGGVTYKNAIYYCSQDVADAVCSLSLDGGVTFGPAIPIFTRADCNGLHGHVKVAADGTVYVPNKACGGSDPTFHEDGNQAVAVSENNGITWTVRLVTTSKPVAQSLTGTSTQAWDPSVAVATDGTLYFGYQNVDGHAHVAVSHDKGQTWVNDVDVGALAGVQNTSFPEMVAGDPDRAAFAFFGSPTAGTDYDQATFAGVWYLYIGTTYDGGRTWTTINATPGDPIQRGGICGSGTCRNLLDFFDATIDKEGRVLVGYDDGCISAACINGTAGNDFTSKNAIARQLTGKRMFAAYDSCGNATPTPTPTATPTPIPTPTATPTPGLTVAPIDPGPKVGYQNFEAPGILTNVTSSSQGPSAKTVEYLGHDAGEPSIGNNWKTGTTVYQSDLQTLFVNFNDTCPSNGQVATWVNRPAPTSQFVDSDPIGFTDRYTGRTFAGELTLTSPTCKTSFTDDDGQMWIPTQGSGLGASVDHETIGGGPFHAPLTRPTNVPGLYPDAVYYCSQLPHAACARSDDGGASFGPIVEVDPVADGHCGGLHGHIKVAPDGTIYLPFYYCDSQGATIVSEDNGVTWTIRHVPNTVSDNLTSTSSQDPAVGIDNNGRAYFLTASGIDKRITKAIVATTDDHGATWQNVFDLGAQAGLKNIAYPAAVAADPGRAAVAFYGTTTEGDESANGFTGVWHLYIGETFDGGQHWTLSDVTPNAPIQRGCIWMHGGANICRNLLDFFDMTVDSQGRVEVGYVNGCAGGNCAQAAATAHGNAYTALAVIARQSSGRRLVAAYDPPNALNAVSVPGMPSVTTRRVGNVVHLGWSLADNGNSTITGYNILRSTSSGAETLLTAVSGPQNSFDDTTATDTTKTYYYKVQAVNAVGTSCGDNEVAAPYVGDTCGGLILQKNDPSHPESLLASQNPSLAIDYIAAGEPPGTSDLMFRMKVSTLSSVPANSRWRIVWNSESAPGQQWYVGMRSDANSQVTFEYGSIATAVVGLVIGVPTETRAGSINGTYSGDGTITMFVSKALVGNPQPGDLLGAVNGRTFTGDTAETGNLERSTLLIDHTFVKAQRDNGSPAATYMIAGNTDCSPFIEQNVNSLVTLQVSNPSTSLGMSSYSLSIKNSSTQTIYVPLRVEVVQITSASGKVTVKNADNSASGSGASWDFSHNVGADNVLSAGETSSPRQLQFNNPNNEPFTVTFNVIGTLARSSSGTSRTNSISSGGSSDASSPGVVPDAAATGLVFQISYNPLLNTVASQIFKP